jgi:hypothetical protein
MVDEDLVDLVEVPAAVSDVELRLSWQPVAPRFGPTGRRYDKGGYEATATWLSANRAHGRYLVERIRNGVWRAVRRETAAGGLLGGRPRRWAGRVIGRPATAAEAIALAEADDAARAGAAR